MEAAEILSFIRQVLCYKQFLKMDFDYLKIKCIFILLSLSSLVAQEIDVPCVTALPDSCYIEQAINLNPNEKLNLLNISEPKNITELILEVPSTLNSIPKEIFTQLPELLCVSLHQAGISTLSKTHLRNATQLRRLDLSFNKIRMIPQNAILLAMNLMSLDLSENQIVNIEVGAFRSRLLMYLDLSQNKLRSLQNGIFSGARMLRYVFLENNALKFIEDGTFKLPHLKVISLNENYMKTLSTGLFTNVPELQEINLKSNELTEVGKAFINLPNLTKLRLDNNPALRDLDITSLLDLPSLLELRLQNTNLTLPITLPNQTISYLLKTLDLSNNSLNRSALLVFLEMLEAEELILNDTSVDDDMGEEILDLIPRLNFVEINSKRFWRNSTSEIRK